MNDPHDLPFATIKREALPPSTGNGTLENPNSSLPVRSGTISFQKSNTTSQISIEQPRATINSATKDPIAPDLVEGLMGNPESSTNTVATSGPSKEEILATALKQK